MRLANRPPPPTRTSNLRQAQAQAAAAAKEAERLAAAQAKQLADAQAAAAKAAAEAAAGASEHEKTTNAWCIHAAQVFQVPPGGGEAGGWGNMAQTEYRQAWTANNCADRVAKAGGVPVAIPTQSQPAAVAAAATAVVDAASLSGAAWCVHMAQTHAVQPGISWGSMEEKSDQKRWKTEGCDQVDLNAPPPAATAHTGVAAIAAPAPVGAAVVPAAATTGTAVVAAPGTNPATGRGTAAYPYLKAPGDDRPRRKGE